MSLAFKDISDAPADLDVLGRFYDGIYVTRLSRSRRARIVGQHEALSRAPAGRLVRGNCYHIILALDGDRPGAASVSDYLARRIAA